ncbi:hypothetical protein A3K34_04740 [candidate division WWE3 bacterium RIFOXYC1_FULL_40_10]|uniref:Uncharacterized protein n=1 Tax=candidate division WWE3 bacterium RIFOXYA2_FULL_46_9 TaxID=1802636 RepID=A0A1F4W1K7_UNCKA|nr:MAG: hypothetical protein A3K58_04740 [candidate division WWE3 bacterium RIFOXYB1_FULL_40_22]OGC62145.1 MAG: hypothetical protein A3K37_04740 [candidate division WWE3 bacterium RIFOXYA1_FULL_40_11]OGC63158.1 MAG: hypothetical protein A2264_00485 [candidate division WWE3 bacterium RIFOXYA2_FULL_46_9]OGC65238.1 MAG: hypothetical protein A2326_04120 [candidate division WWE3 bacterium RIFOXYB2_FULL_41_6]OGC66528.1 MAG: hypothetical protein A3K34_04740 [candidate division WWE3 bacterium RIFOXYC1_
MPTILTGEIARVSEGGREIEIKLDFNPTCGPNPVYFDGQQYRKEELCPRVRAAVKVENSSRTGIKVKPLTPRRTYNLFLGKILGNWMDPKAGLIYKIAVNFEEGDRKESVHCGLIQHKTPDTISTGTELLVWTLNREVLRVTEFRAVEIR